MGSTLPQKSKLKDDLQETKLGASVFSVDVDVIIPYKLSVYVKLYHEEGVILDI